MKKWCVLTLCLYGSRTSFASSHREHGSCKRMWLVIFFTLGNFSSTQTWHGVTFWKISTQKEKFVSSVGTKRWLQFLSQTLISGFCLKWTLWCSKLKNTQSLITHISWNLCTALKCPLNLMCIIPFTLALAVIMMVFLYFPSSVYRRHESLKGS